MSDQTAPDRLAPERIAPERKPAERIAIVGIGVTFPDAADVDQLWDNVLSGRRAFRTLPEERTSLADYYDPDPAAPDKFYSTKAAVLRDWEFDRVAWRVSASTFRSTDMAHWLALDTCSRALADAGFVDGEGLPRATTGVVLGNTLTGEFSRVNILRLRWPYVRRTVAAQLAETGCSEDEAAGILAGLEVRFKQAFPPITEDSLAGGLANTIAGRICNYYDFGGGGFTVDGACSSSLLAVVDAATALQSGDLDVAICGGVDLSIDPFELTGFAKIGALATGAMKIYDADSCGFWPGEGCGVLVLMRESDARREQRRCYALISGWGVSSDGRGGITRPEADGHRRALDRAYQRAGYPASTVAYLEGHGTGTPVGDATEIRALASTRGDDPDARPAALGSIKGNIGHTKAAAGAAGLIKATLAVHHQLIPPATGHFTPHPALREHAKALYVPRQAEPFPASQPIRAGVSSMGFGGINVHLTLEGFGPRRLHQVPEGINARVRSRQDAELLLFEAPSAAALRDLLDQAARFCAAASEAEVSDLAISQAEAITGRPDRAAHRLAAVVLGPDDAQRVLQAAAERLGTEQAGTLGPVEQRVIQFADRVYYGTGAAGSISFAFPGQGAGIGRRAALAERFGIRPADWPDEDSLATDQAQPRLIRACLHSLRLLRSLNIEADAATGHSLGEIAALAWSGALSEQEAIRLATIRGRSMEDHIAKGGAMLALATDADRAAELATAHHVQIAGYNAPQLTILAGPERATDAVAEAAGRQQISSTKLKVGYAFHTDSCVDAARSFGEQLTTFPIGRPARTVVSTTLGTELDPGADLRQLLTEQITRPVQFLQAAAHLKSSEVIIEVGPGRTLSGLLRAALPDTVVVAVDSDSSSLAPFLGAVGAAFTAGAALDLAPLTRDRVRRPVAVDSVGSFLASPCESAPQLGGELRAIVDADGPSAAEAESGSSLSRSDADSAAELGELSTLDLLRRLLAEKVELPVDSISASTSPLDDLHMSSITIGQVVNDAIRALGNSPSGGVPTFATSTVAEIAELLDQIEASEEIPDDRHPAGLGPWVAAFRPEPVPTPLRTPKRAPDSGSGRGAPDGSDWAVLGGRSAFTDVLTRRLSEYGVSSGTLVSALTTPVEQRVRLITTMLRTLGERGLGEGSREERRQPGPLLLIDAPDHGLAAAAKTALLEGLAETVTVLHLGPELIAGLDQLGLTAPSTGAPQPDYTALLDSICADVADPADFREVQYPDAATRLDIQFVRQEINAQPVGSPLSSSDVIYVTGGAKGITASCAIRLAERSGAALALVGRSGLDDPEVAATLQRLRGLNLRHCYLQVDVTDPRDVASSIEEVRQLLGPVTAVLHGAGLNQPARALDLTEDQFAATLAVKTDGLRNVVDAVDPAELRLLLSFGSIIGRAGLHGEAHYATANAWLADDLVAHAEAHPHCRTVCIEWSVWAGAGMGESLGVLETLRSAGIEPIGSDAGIELLSDIIADPELPTVFVAAGRTGDLPTLPIRRESLPFLRFLETPRIYYPGIELVVDNELSAGSDPYLTDHFLDGDLLFPAVMGLEAMSQAASALDPSLQAPELSDVRFQRPVVVAAAAASTLRVVAQRRGQQIDVAIRTSDTGFAVDHFTATFRPAQPGAEQCAVRDSFSVPDPDLGLAPIAVDPQTELYGSHMFQGARFQAVAGYRVAAARRVVADLQPSGRTDWFHQYLPAGLLLSAPDLRDALMHALQCCVPDAVLLPEGVAEIIPSGTFTGPGAGPQIGVPANTGLYQLQAVERSQDGDVYRYDVTVFDSSGQLAEQWRGLMLRAVRKQQADGLVWAAPLAGSFLQRRAERLLSGDLAVAVEPRAAGDTEDPSGRLASSARALSRIHRGGNLRREPNGQLAFDDGSSISTAHDGVTFAVVSGDAVGCDVESVQQRSDEDWQGLLGAAMPLAREIAASADESLECAATRVWTALECIRKAGYVRGEPTLQSWDGHTEVVLSWAESTICTWTLQLRGSRVPTVFAILSRGRAQ